MTMNLREPASLPRGQQERRHRIVQAAIALLEHGEYDAIQMRDVAREAGVALATIYRYFTSKEHLYAAALVEWATDFESPRQTSTSGATSDEARLRALMRRAIRAFEKYPQMIRSVTVLETSTDPNARACFDEFAALNSDALTDALSSFDDDTAAAIIDTANSVMVTRLRSWSQGRTTIREVHRRVEQTLDLIFSPAPTAAG
jgi:TetR/AcrR family transcriptional regulator, cholesterol catabolism regulator